MFPIRDKIKSPLQFNEGSQFNWFGSLKTNYIIYRTERLVGCKYLNWKKQNRWSIAEFNVKLFAENE